MKIKVLLHEGGNHEHDKITEVEMPPLYRRVWRGPLVQGDLFFDVIKQEWVPVCLPTEKEIKRNDPYSNVTWYACVIRPGVSDVDKPCEACEVRPAITHNRFCRLCAREIVVKHRKKN